MKQWIVTSYSIITKEGIMKLIILCVIIINTLVGTPANVQYGRSAQSKVHDINSIELVISNYGKIGELYWPKTSGCKYLYGAGIWFGVIDSLGDTLVSIGYGPHGGESEFRPGLAGQNPEDPSVIIYMYAYSWPGPQAIFPMAPQDTFSQQDSWCCYNDTDITAHVPGDTRPIGIEVYQTGYAWQLTGLQSVIYLIWTVKNITNDTLKNCIFSFCADPDIGNESGTGNDVMSGIIGQWFVINGESLYVDNFAYVWQNEVEPIPTPPWWPGAIGCDFLQSPWDLVENADKDEDGILDQYERDSAYYWNNLPPEKWDIDLDGVPDWRDPNQIPQVGLTSLRRFTLNLEPNLDNERYMTMAGYNYKTGIYWPYDTQPSQPDDQRFLMSAGKFALEPDSEATITIAFMLVNWDSLQERPDTALVPLDHYCQYIYDINWLLPQAPPPPHLTCIPGDAQVTLLWDNLSEITPDPFYAFVSDPAGWIYDPYYRQYDFEGYRIWRSETGQAGTWELIGACDLYNGITFESVNPDGGDTLRAEDTGIFHSYLDDDVRNGFTYYYAVTSFDHNCVISTYDSIWVIDSIWYAPESIWIYVYDSLKVTGPCALMFESGQVSVQSAPRRDPTNFVPGRCSLEIIYGNEKLLDNIAYSITYPLAMNELSFYVCFGPVTYQDISEKDTVPIPSMYTAYLENSNQALIDSVHIETNNQTIAVNHAFPTLNGVTVSINFLRDSLPADQSIFEYIETYGSYPESLVTVCLPGPWASYFAFWAYRGNDYQIKWYSTTGSAYANTVRVIDIMSGDTIPYHPYNPEPNHTYDKHANAWCFQSHLDVSDTLVLFGSPPATRNTKYLYINGGLVGLNRGGPMMPGDPVPSISDIWTVHAHSDFAPAPANALFEIHSIPAYFDSVTRQTLNVKVVPNPYVFYNEWEQRRFPRKLKFINLPHRCTIRIFNLNGELVKTLLHTHTSEPEQEQILNDAGGDEWWDMLNEERQFIASGIYIYHVQSTIGEQISKFVVIR